MHPTTPIQCWTETIDIEHDNYDMALLDAIKEFKRKHPWLDSIDEEDFEVMDYELG